MDEQLIVRTFVDEEGRVSEARYSRCEKYRYDLVRRFDPRDHCSADVPLEKRVAFIGLNPSTATERRDDPTVARCIGFAQRWGFREFIMLNLFGLRSTDPRHLKFVRDPIGGGNDAAIEYWAKRSALVVCCWGYRGKYLDRDGAVCELLRRCKTPTKCFGVNRDGTPRHPLYLPRDAKLSEFDTAGRGR